MMMIAALLVSTAAADAPKSSELELPTVTITVPKTKQQSPYQFTVIRDADDGLIVLSI